MSGLAVTSISVTWFDDSSSYSRHSPRRFVGRKTSSLTLTS
jgi:hypothetical protein